MLRGDFTDDYRGRFSISDTYRAESADAAAATPPADRANPRTGCNGFPFTGMQRADV